MSSYSADFAPYPGRWRHLAMSCCLLLDGRANRCRSRSDTLCHGWRAYIVRMATSSNGAPSSRPMVQTSEAQYIHVEVLIHLPTSVWNISSNPSTISLICFQHVCWLYTLQSHMVDRVGFETLPLLSGAEPAGTSSQGAREISGLRRRSLAPTCSGLHTS